MQGNSRRWMWQGIIGCVFVLALMALVSMVATAGEEKDKDDDDQLGWLGIYIQNVDKDVQDAWDLPSDNGVLVSDVVDDSPAEDAGLESGDVILEFNGKKVTSTRRLTRWIEDSKPGSEIDFKIFREGKEKKLAAKVGKQTEWSGDYEFNFEGPGPHLFHGDNWSMVIPPMPDHEPYFFSMGMESGPRLGVQLRGLNKQMATYFGVRKGSALIEEVLEDSPAEQAGLAAGDVIVAINGTDVDDADEVREEIREFEKGDEITVTVVRRGDRKDFAVTVDEDETWSGIGRLRGFHTQPQKIDDIYNRQWNERRDAVRGLDDAMRRNRGTNDDLRDLLEDQRVEVEKLRKEIDELKERVKDLK